MARNGKIVTRLKWVAGIAIMAIFFGGLAIATLLFLGYRTASKPVSYLPEVRINDLAKNSNTGNQAEIINRFFKLSLDTDGKIKVETTDGQVIMSDIVYCCTTDSAKSVFGLNNTSVRKTCDSIISVTGTSDEGAIVNISLIVRPDDPRLDVKVRTSYTRKTIVWREALVACFDVPVTEVYRKNRQIDIGTFEREYSLHKQGVRFGYGERSALVYHTPSISSLQLDTEKKLLFFNLDYYKDHPYIYFPYQPDGGGKWIDYSCSQYYKGEVRENELSIWFGTDQGAIPRLMMVPSGNLAGYVFTEHADETNMNTQRAVYFGSEDITQTEDAVSGFVGHRIPVTKSVFYSDSARPSVKDDPSFLDFLDQLYATGIYEVCLHTPDNLNSNRLMLEESIQFMKKRYDATTWIDHGFYNGKDNRESFAADGLNPASQFYTADLWEEYNTRYFWNYALEMPSRIGEKKPSKLLLYQRAVADWRSYMSPRELNEEGFVNALKELYERRQFSRFELNSLYPVKGDSYPVPLYYLHPTKTRNFYSWSTGYVKYYENLSENTFKHELNLLDRLITNQGVFINHGYFSRIRQGNDVLNEEQGKIVIDPYFDRILTAMANMRDQGDLYITTIRELLEYWISLEKVSFKYYPEGVVYVSNDNDTTVKGLSLIVRTAEVTVNGNLPEFRRVGEDLIFWFDIPARQRIILKIRQ